MITIPPEIKKINIQLVDHFGIDTSTGQPLWRVAWSDDQYEKRLMETTDEGLFLLYPEVREVPKYSQWISHRWVLERLVVVPGLNERELPSAKLSYEPMWVFENKNREALPPKFEACKFVVDTVYAAQGKTSLAKYKDPEGNPQEAIELKKKRIDDLTEAIYGDETDVTDALTRQEGIVVPHNYHSNKES